MADRNTSLPVMRNDFPYLCITFGAPDSIKIIHGDQETLDKIRDVIKSAWPKGIQKEQSDHGVYAIRVKGSPFDLHTPRDDAIASKRMCCQLLSSLKQIGWRLSIASDLTRTGSDRTTWFFKRITAESNDAAASKPASNVICLSMSSTDKLQLINVPENMRQAVIDAVRLVYRQGISGLDIVMEQYYEIKLNGEPWASNNLEVGLMARRALLQIIRIFDAQQFRLIGTVNLKDTTDSLFFEQDQSVASGETRYMMLSLNCDDCIRMSDAPQEAIDRVRQCIVRHWTLGMQAQDDCMASQNYFEFKLHGSPWNCEGVEAINARLLLTVIMKELLSLGWAVHTSLDVTRRPNDKAVFVFRSCPPIALPHFCLSPNGTNKIRLINAPADIIDVTISVIKANWPQGIQAKGPHSGCYEFCLNGAPWDATVGIDAAMMRHLLCVLLDEFAKKEWGVICSADVSAKVGHQLGRDSVDVHSWFLAQTPAVRREVKVETVGPYPRP